MYQTETAGGDQVEISFENQELRVNGSPFKWTVSKEGRKKYLVLKDHKTFKCEIVNIDSITKSAEIKVNKTIYKIELKDKMDILLEKMGIDMSAVAAVNDLKAPMPGLVLDILVEEGQEIHKGDQLIVLEAMKMENVLKAEGDGIIKSIEVNQGTSVEKNQILINF